MQIFPFAFEHSSQPAAAISCNSIEIHFTHCGCLFLCEVYMSSCGRLQAMQNLEYGSHFNEDRMHGVKTVPKDWQK